MGFLSGLGKVLSIAAPIAAAPFTGGTSLAALAPALGAAGQAMSGIGNVASNAAAGAADGRVQEALLNQQSARDREAGVVDRAQFTLDAPNTRAIQAVRGNLISNVQDVNIGRPEGSTIPTFEVQGGIRPSTLGPEARQAGDELSRQALLKLMTGEGVPEYQGGEIPQAGVGSKILGGVGLGGSLLGALGQALPRQDPSAPTDQPTATPPWLAASQINRQPMPALPIPGAQTPPEMTFYGLPKAPQRRLL